MLIQPKGLVASGSHVGLWDPGSDHFHTAWTFCRRAFLGGASGNGRGHRAATEGILQDKLFHHPRYEFLRDLVWWVGLLRIKAGLRPLVSWGNLCHRLAL